MTRIKLTTCPWCDRKLDRVTAVVEKGTMAKGVEEPVAENGDATLCIACGMTSIFDDTVRAGLRFPTRQEWIDLEGEKMMVGLLTAHSMAAPNFRKPLRTILYKPDWM